MQAKHPFAQFDFCPKCGSKHFMVNNEKAKKCEDCNFVYYFNSCASTVALIINDNDEILVATRAHEPVKGTLDLPGGFVDMYETGEDAVKREVKEESGLEVSDLRYLYSIPNIYEYSGFDVHTLDLVYLCKVGSRERIVPADDVAKLEYIKISELNPEAFGLTSVREIIKNIKNIKI